MTPVLPVELDHIALGVVAGANQAQARKTGLDPQRRLGDAAVHRDASVADGLVRVAARQLREAPHDAKAGARVFARKRCCRMYEEEEWQHRCGGVCA